MYKSRSAAIVILLAIFVTKTSSAKVGEKTFTDQLFESVYRVVGKDGYVATGFFLQCQGDSMDRPSTVLVSARHVFEDIQSDSAGVLLRKEVSPGEFEVYGYGFLIRDENGPLWINHPDSIVDLAALPLPLPANVDVRVIGRSFIATVQDYEKYQIDAGEKLHYLGYPLGESSGPGDFALLRTGFIASHPVRPDRPFLVDGDVVKGNSGGLVYLEPELRINHSGRVEQLRPKIVGVMTTAQATVTRDRTRPDSLKIADYLNLGGVISSVRLLELIDFIGCK